MFFIIRPKYQLILSIDVDQILDFLFNDKEVLLVKLIETHILIHKFDRLKSLYRIIHMKILYFFRNIIISKFVIVLKNSYYTNFRKE